MSEVARELLVTIQMHFPDLDREHLAEHLAPVVREAIAAGGSWTSISAMESDADEENEE